MSKKNENVKDFLNFSWAGKDKAIQNAVSLTDKQFVAKKIKA